MVCVWVDKQLLLLLHDESLAEHGGAAGIRDEGLLDSALARPLNLIAYGEPDLAELAASYGVGLAKNHAFVDGNKRAAFLAVGLFLRLNGHRLNASPAAATVAMIDVAAGTLNEADFADWIRRHSAPVSSPPAQR
jgi:death-on-curing protein